MMNTGLSNPWLRQLGIVIPTLNAGRFLPDTLASVAKLVAVGTRAVVVDGGSVDDTEAICVRYGFDVVTEKRSGIYAAVNTGCRQLGTRWLTWINGDDVLFASGLEAYGGDLEAADIHYGTVDFIDADGRFLHAWRSASPPRLRPLFRVGCSPLLQQGTIFRHEVFDGLGGFDEGMKFVADADFWWRAFDSGGCLIRRLPVFDYIVRKCPRSMPSRCDGNIGPWLSPGSGDRDAATRAC